MKFRQIKIFLLLGLVLLVTNPPAQPAHAWGLVSHQFIVEQAMGQLDDDWKGLFNTLISKLKAGSIYPDSLHGSGDTPNHLYYPDNPTAGTAPQAVERYFNFYIDNLTAGNYQEAIFSAGVFAHYMSDVNMPVHTGAYWDGHSAYETDINQHLTNLQIGSITIDTDISNIKQYVIDAATKSHAYYNDIVAAYPTGSTTNVITTNATIKTITETQITSAISNVASLFKKGIADTLVPRTEKISGGSALIDYAHGNDYATGGGSSAFALDDYENYLVTKGFTVVKNNDTFTTSLLNNYDFLIITALGTNLTSDELNAVSQWLTTGQRSLFITGRGDFQSYSHAGINELLKTTGTAIRVNDDNVYTIDTDPNYYKEHYVYSDVVTPPTGETYPAEAVIYHSYAPNSLYFEGDSTGVTVLVNGSKYNYQFDQNAPAPAKIWDDTNDGNGGERIPLVAAESLSGDNDRIVVFGASDFSDFSLGPSGFHDDEYFIPVFTKWVLFGSIGEGISYLPNIKITTPETSFKAGTVTIDYAVSSNVVEVQLLVDGAVKNTTSTGPFTNFVFKLESGVHNITLVAKTASGDQMSKSVELNGTGSGSINWEFLFSLPIAFAVIYLSKKKKMV